MHTSQFQFIGDLGGNVLESDAGSRYALESHPVQRQTRELADFDLPLDKRVGVGIAVDAQQKESFALLVIAVVGIQHLLDFLHDFVWIPG